MPSTELVHQDELTIPKSMYVTQPFDSSFHSEWFKKPVKLLTGVLSSTDLADTFTVIKHPKSTLDQEVYQKKWEGYGYWRGTIIYTLQVNASPFQAGLYALSYLPVCGPFGNSTLYTRWINSHYNTLMQRSQLPHVEIDLSQHTSCTLVVPYVSPYDKIPLRKTSGMDPYFDIGNVNIWPISPLNVGAGQDSTAGFTLWAHMEDVHLEVPVYPQSGLKGRGRKMPMDKEQGTKNIGPVTSALTTLGKVSGVLAKVPLLNQIAAPAAWALDIAAGVSGAFGWSKPTNLDVQRRIQKDLMYGMQHVDSSDNSKVLALFENNTIEILPGFGGTDQDELTLDSFLTRPTILQKFLWESTQTSNINLASVDFNPNILEIATSQDGVIVHNMTPLCLMSQYFSYWRGDFVFTLHLIKTKLHSGRLEISFVPYTTYTTPALTPQDGRPYEWREIIDVRDQEKWTFRIPYHFFKSYRPIGGSYFNSLGLVIITVLDELVAPSTASQSIEGVIWVQAAPGFEFAVPRSSTIVPTYGLTPVYTQSGLLGQNSTTYDTMFGNSNAVTDEENDHARKAIGEKVTSLRQLLRVARFMTVLDPDLLTPVTGTTGLSPYVYPVMTRFAGVTTLPEFCGDLMSTLGLCYAMSRGGIRIKTVTDTTGLVMQTLVNRTVDTNSPAFYVVAGTTFTGNGASFANSVSAISSVSDRGGTESVIPAYGMTHSRSSSACVYDKTQGIAVNTSIPPIFLELTTSNARVLRIIRGGADDFNLGLFVSIPPMTFINPTPT